MFGSEIRIQPIFWASCVLIGSIIYRDPISGGVGTFCFWLAAVSISLLAHETSHILAARLLGARIRIVLSGLGGQVLGLDEVKRWQRNLILLAGSLGNLLILGILLGLTAIALPSAWRVFLAFDAWLLMWINAFWIALNLLPLWPLDGGRVAVEIGESLLGHRGRIATLLVSLTVSLLLSLFVAAWARLTLTKRYDSHYTLHLIFFCIQILYCYFFWVSAFRALWGDTMPLNESGKTGRAA